jgi:hypothetical protein
VEYTQIATISTDDHHTLQEFRASVSAQWTFLSDPDRTVQKDLDIQEYTDPEHNPMIPHTLVLKPGIVIHRVYNGYWFLGPPVRRRPLARPARRDKRNPPRLGFERPWTPRSLMERRQSCFRQPPSSVAVTASARQTHDRPAQRPPWHSQIPLLHWR